LTQVAGNPDRTALELRDIEELVAAPDRQIHLRGLFNLRDLGGYPTASGNAVAWGRLFRSDALSKLDRDDVELMAGLGLRTIVDLRTHVEAEAAPTVSGLPAQITHLSLLIGDLQTLPIELSAIYHYMIDECGETIGQAVKLLCAEDAMPALVHCSAGKDRTGIVSALVLAFLGVPDELIAADYALSAINLDPESTPAIGQLQAATGLGERLTASLLASPPHLILEVLNRARANYGSVEDYLLANGVTEAELARLSASLTG
jgi:protein-tyrosine phosphatase